MKKQHSGRFRNHVPPASPWSSSSIVQKCRLLQPSVVATLFMLHEVSAFLIDSLPHDMSSTKCPRTSTSNCAELTYVSCWAFTSIKSSLVLSLEGILNVFNMITTCRGNRVIERKQCVSLLGMWIDCQLFVMNQRWLNWIGHIYSGTIYNHHFWATCTTFMNSCSVIPDADELHR